MEHLLKKLQNLSESDFYPYHMPGHKRNGASVFATDITEIDDFDNLHHATGILKDAQDRAARLYGSQESFFLVNGSTCGLLAAVFASFKRGDKVLVARNCHKAVYHAIEIRGLEPVYIYPEIDDGYDIAVGITAEQVKEALDESSLYAICSETEGACAGDKEAYGKLKGMILTSPTYEGLTSEIKEIADLLHDRDMVLIVDEAHGAHFGFHKAFPESAIKQGADLVIQSLHKTLPSMTQTALLHRCSERIKAEKIQKYLGVFQTSSPSYVFMAYMDECIRLLEEQGRELFDAFADKLNHFAKQCENFKHVKVPRPAFAGDKLLEKTMGKVTSDPGKIVITADGYTGKELYDILRNRYHLQPEMCAGSYVLAIMTICDTQEGFARLYEALAELDNEIDVLKTRPFAEAKNEDIVEKKQNETLVSLLQMRPIIKYASWKMETKKVQKIKLSEAVGQVSGEYIYLYPPGIPFIVPGEVLSEDAVTGLLEMQSRGYELQGMSDMTGEYIYVVEAPRE